MEDDLAVIERVIAEHKTIRQRFQTLEKVANDAEAMMGFEAAKEAFMPGRLNQKQGLNQLKDTMDTIETGVHRHFDFEELYLPPVVDRHGDEEQKSTLRSILLEHVDLKGRLDHSKNHAAELIGGGMARHRWEASAHDMRAYISHTRQLMQAHVVIEQELLHNLRKKLKE